MLPPPTWATVQLFYAADVFDPDGYSFEVVHKKTNDGTGRREGE